MNDNYYEQYDILIEEILQQYIFENKLRNRVTNPIILFKLIIKFRTRLLKRRKTDDVYLKLSLFDREVFKELAKEIEINDQKFKIIHSEYPIQSLGNILFNKYKHLNFNIMSKIHSGRVESKRKGLLSIKSVFALLVGLGTFILQITPEVVIENLNINYEKFQTYTFWITIGLIGYIATGVIAIISKQIRAQKAFNYIANILDYLKIIEE